jgi:hypothetical protein
LGFCREQVSDEVLREFLIADTVDDLCTGDVDQRARVAAGKGEINGGALALAANTERVVVIGESGRERAVRDLVRDLELVAELLDTGVDLVSQTRRGSAASR